MYRRFRKSLIKLETNAHIPYVMRSILRHMRIDHEEVCIRCEGMTTAYTEEEYRLLDPDNSRIWNFCTCQLEQYPGWKEISRELYWWLRKKRKASYKEDWVRLYEKKWTTDDGKLHIEAIDGVNPESETFARFPLFTSHETVKYRREGFIVKYYRTDNRGWRNDNC